MSEASTHKPCKAVFDLLMDFAKGEAATAAGLPSAVSDLKATCDADKCRPVEGDCDDLTELLKANSAVVPDALRVVLQILMTLETAREFVQEAKAADIQTRRQVVRELYPAVEQLIKDLDKLGSR